MLGLEPALLALFVGVGLPFGFFGTGGALLVTSALLVLGDPSRVAVESGLAFVFGTSVIGAHSTTIRDWSTTHSPRW